MTNLKLIIVGLVLILFSGCSNIALVEPIPTINNGTFVPTEDILTSAARGELEGGFVVYKFGANDGVGTSIEPVSLSGNYRTPTTATSLEILSDDGDDTLLGAGARSVLVQGLNGSGDQIQEIVNLSGTTPVALQNSYLRIYRAYVYSSGTYATQSAPSQQGTITIRETGAGQTWAIINTIDGGFGVGQTEIAVYTVPKGYYCLLLDKSISVNSNKLMNVYFFQRTNILDTTAPYNGTMRLVEKQIGVSGYINIFSRTRISKFEELTDVGFMAETQSGTGEISAEFELLCLDNTLY